MQTIEDRFGNSWSYQITLGKVCDEINSKLKVNLLSPAEDAGAIQNMLRNVGMAMDALWILNREAAEGKEVKTVNQSGDEVLIKITCDKDWFDLFEATHLRKAMDSLHEEVLFFIQTLLPEEAVTVKKSLSRAAQIRKIELEKIAEVMDSEEIDKMATEEMNRLMEVGLNQLREALQEVGKSEKSTE